MEDENWKPGPSPKIDPQSVTTVRRQTANSGRVDYSEPTVLYDSAKSRVCFVPYFIGRSAGNTELAVKIITYKKQSPPAEWLQIDQKSITLKEPAARELLKALEEHFEVARLNSKGEFIVIRVNDAVADVSDLDPEVVASAVADILSKKDIVQHLANRELSSELVNAFRGAIRLRELRQAVAELRANLDNGVTDERTYQVWCNKHSWAFGNAYLIPDYVSSISTGDKLDLLIPTVLAGFRDVVELKRPDMEVLNYDPSHKNFYHSSEVTKAIGQCHRYLDVLHEVAANGLRDHPEVVAYHPRATVVIGRSKGWGDDKLKALHGLNHRLSGITVMTYDHLLAQGERLIGMLNDEASSDSEAVESGALNDVEDIFGDAG